MNYLNKILLNKTILYWLAGFIVVEAMSFLAYYLPDLTLPFFVLLTFLFIALAIKNYTLAVLVALAEIFIGSHGHVFTLTSFGLPISIRIVFFVILAGFGLAKLAQDRKKVYEILKKDNIAKLLVGLVVLVGLATLNGVVRGYPFSDIFFDANNYLFIGFIIPLLVVFQNENFTDRIVDLLILCGLYVSVKTLFLTYLFTNSFYAFFLPDLYTWLRDSRLGEFTPTTTGAYRIFFQSQFYLFPVWWIIIWRTRLNPIWQEKTNLTLLGLVSAALLISFSRSFWLGWGISGLVFGLYLLWQKEWVTIIRTFVASMCSIALGFLFIWLSINFPLPLSDKSASLDFVDRLNISTEAAASSRWNLLGPLWNEVSESWLLGKGLGASVTYISNDPRVRSIDHSGEYTTTAFEWGYLDQWLEFGILGIFIYLLLGILLFNGLMKTKHKFALPLAISVVTLYTIHVGSPYLNHPLGITFILLSIIFIWHDRDIRQLAQYS